MKSNEANIFIFIASIIIGVLISMNISLNKVDNRVFLSSKQYVDAYNYRTKLFNEISGMKEQYEKYATKLLAYENNKSNEEKVISDIGKELSENKLILGKTKVKGQGIKIAITDANSEYFLNEPNPDIRIIHDKDVIEIINDLRNAGAEAIAINEQRIVNTSEVYCSGPFLKINGVFLPQPYYINAIGNKETLENYMMEDEHHLKSLIMRKINVMIEQDDEITIPAYTGETSVEFLSGAKIK